MRKSLMFLAAVLFLTCTSAFADNVTYTVTGLGQNYDLTFVEPSTLGTLDTFVPVTFTKTGVTVPVAVVQFFDTFAMGLFNVSFIDSKGVFEEIDFLGPQAYSGSNPFNLSAGIFSISAGAIFKGDDVFDFFQGGKNAKVFAGSKAKAMPEPASFMLLGLGIAAIAAFRRKQLLA